MTDLFKVINKDGYNHLYCYPLRIRTNNEEVECPTFPFKIPEEESFTTGTHVYISERKTLTTSRWEAEIAASKINYKLGSHVVPIILETKPTPSFADGLSSIKPTDWIKWKPNTTLSGLVSTAASETMSWSLRNTTYFSYAASIIIILFALSFIMPMIGIVLWMGNRASLPVRTLIKILRKFPKRPRQEALTLPRHVEVKKRRFL